MWLLKQAYTYVVGTQNNDNEPEHDSPQTKEDKNVMNNQTNLHQRHDLKSASSVRELNKKCLMNIPPGVEHLKYIPHKSRNYSSERNFNKIKVDHPPNALNEYTKQLKNFNKCNETSAHVTIRDKPLGVKTENRNNLIVTTSTCPTFEGNIEHISENKLSYNFTIDVEKSNNLIPKVDLEELLNSLVTLITKNSQELKSLEICPVKVVKLDNYEMALLHKLAQFIVIYSKITKDIQYKNQNENTITTMSEENCGIENSRQNLQTVTLYTRETLSTTSITELDTTENTLGPIKQTNINPITEETYKLNKTAKRNCWKSKSINLKRRKDSTFLPPRQCFGRSALHMKANQEYTNSNLELKIRKELQPTKDQIKELQHFLIAFNKGNYQHDINYLKPCTLSEISFISSENTYRTLPLHSQQLHCLTESLRSLPDYRYSEMYAKEKSLSPLADMYIKLSHH